ncbi:hypothetical protein D9M68_559860 [compost metagenome]
MIDLGLGRSQPLGLHNVVCDVPTDAGDLCAPIGAAVAGSDVADVAQGSVRQHDPVLRAIFQAVVQAAEQRVGGDADVLRMHCCAPLLIGRFLQMDLQPMQVEHAIVPGALLRFDVDLPDADLGRVEREVQPVGERHHLPFPRFQLGNVALPFVEEPAGQEDRDYHDCDSGGDRQANGIDVFGKLVPLANRHGCELPSATRQIQPTRHRCLAEKRVVAEERILDPLLLGDIPDREVNVDVAMILRQFRRFAARLQEARGAIERPFIDDGLDIAPALHPSLDLGKDRQEKLEAVAAARQANGADHHGSHRRRCAFYRVPCRAEPVEIGAGEPLLAFTRKGDPHNTGGRSRSAHHLRVLEKKLRCHDGKIVRRHRRVHADAVGKSVQRGDVGVYLRLQPVGDEVQFVLDIDPEVTLEVFAILPLIDVPAGKHDEAGDRRWYERWFRKSGCRPNALAQNVDDLQSFPLDPQPKVASEP